MRAHRGVNDDHPDKGIETTMMLGLVWMLICVNDDHPDKGIETPPFAGVAGVGVV